MTIDDFQNFAQPQHAFECWQSHVSRGFTSATAMVATMVLYGAETYGEDVITGLRDWVIQNTKGTDVI